MRLRGRRARCAGAAVSQQEAPAISKSNALHFCQAHYIGVPQQLHPLRLCMAGWAAAVSLQQSVASAACTRSLQSSVPYSPNTQYC